MFFKPIVTLLLMIAIGLIGTSSLGEGIFGFKTTASGTKVLEEVRDYDVAMDTFKVSDAEVRTVVQFIQAEDIAAGGAGDWTPAEVSTQLISESTLLEAGANITVAGTAEVQALTGATAEGLYITLAGEAGTGLTADLCNELNDLLGNDDPVLFGTETQPLIPVAANFAAVLTAVPALDLGVGTEGVCIEVADENTLVFYSQQN